MTDSELRELVLQKFYDKRHEDLLQLNDVISVEPSNPTRIANICDHLAQLRLIDWETNKSLEGNVGGLGKISADGVVYIEKKKLRQSP